MLNVAGSARVASSEAPSKATRDRGSGVLRPEAPDLPSRPPVGPSRLDPIAIATGVLSVFAGLIFLAGVGGYRGSLSTHFSQLLMGCSFVALGLNCPIAARLLAVPIGLLNLATFVGYITFGPPGFDTIIIWTLWRKAPRFYSGDLNADLAYALTAIAIFLLTQSGWDFRWRPITVVLAGSAVLGLSFVGLLGWYLTGQQTAYGLRRMMNVHLHTVIAIGILGVGILALAWRKNRQCPAERYTWILLVVAVTAFVVSSSLWQASLLVPKLPIESTQQFRLYLERIVLFFSLLATASLIVAVSLVQKFRHLNEELEQRVQRQTAELQAANKELEAFAYSVSHDLRAPLRHLSGFSELLLQESSNLLNQASRHYIDEIRDAADRMRHLVDDLLNFSRMSRQDLHTRPVLLNCLVEEVLRELAAETADRKIEWQIGALPEVEGDPILLKQVLANLLSNAVKFTRPRSPAVIEVGEAVVKGKRAIFVRDNGVGFNMRYAEKLFGVFQRLHRADEFEGTGIGLATVQRIVHRHGGRVWADAHPEKGATFYFTLTSLSRWVASRDRGKLASSTTRGSTSAPVGAAGKSALENRQESLTAWAPGSAAQRTSDPVAIATGILSALLGLIFLGFASSLRGSLNTHFSLAVMGCAFVAMGLNWPVLARALAIPIGLFNLITFVGYVKFGPPGLDSIILETVWPNAPKLYSGDLNADLGYALTAIAIWLLTKPEWNFRWRSTAIVLAGSSVLGFGCVGLTGYLTGLRTAYGLHRLVEVTFDSIVGILILGAGLLVISWRQGRHVPAERQSWILMVVATSGFVVTTSLWQALMLVHKLPIESTQQFRSDIARTVLVFGLLATAVLGVAVNLLPKLRNLNGQLKQLVQRQTAELQAANKELEAFTYSVSHDLRAPLRHLSGFSELLLQESSNLLNQASRHYIDEIRDAADRMRHLVDDLLDFSRMSRQDLHTRPVLLNCLVEEVLRELAAETADRKIEWQIGALPEVEGDPILLKQVFANLLSNAVKFTRPRSPAVIEVGEAVVKGKRAIFVRDNGVGFNMRYAEKLFGVFQRLHRADEFEGTGIGLATVQRIVHRHGGRVWADAQPEKGATFYFTLGFVELQQSQEAHYESAIAG